MQLRLKQRTVTVLATKNPFVEETFFHLCLKQLCDRLEMLADFVIYAALRAAAVVTVAASLTRKRLEQILAFGQLAQAQVEDASPLTIYQHDSQARQCAQQMSQRLEMKVTIHEKLRARQSRRQVKFTPDVFSRAGKDSLGMCTVASQFSRQAKDAVQVGTGEFYLRVVLPLRRDFGRRTFRLRISHGLAHQILDQNRIFFVRPVARRGRLKIESYGARPLIMKLCEFSNLFVSNAHKSAPRKGGCF